MQNKIEKASQISNLINGWGKIVVAFFSVVGYGFITYYQIKTNSSDIQKLHITIEDNNKAIEREFEVWGDRSNKRYDRAMKTADVIMKQNLKQDDHLLDLEKRLSFIEGKLSNE